VEGLVRDGRILATHRDAAIALLDYLDLHDREVILHDGRRASALRLLEEVLREMRPADADARLAAYAEIEARERGISFSEAFQQVGKKYPELVRDYLNFSSRRVAGESARGNPLQRLNLAAERMARTQNISFAEAYRRVQLDDPRLARECVSFYMS
jgi:hypothetical protein